jgi:S-adenosylmethionine-diacylgycerolhomoserine-N-methlytransferase
VSEALAEGRGAADLMDRMYRYQRHIYDATRKYYLLGRDSMLAQLSPPPTADLLEIGCGTGRNLVKAAELYPAARLFGLDVSCEMLTTAERAIAKAGLGGRIRTAQADATNFDSEALFGVSAFDRIFVSYALSMIPNWGGALAAACEHLAPNGALHIVDFGDQAELPGLFRDALQRWLALFSVHPCLTLEADLTAFCASRGMRCAFTPRFRRYAFLAELKRA